MTGSSKKVTGAQSMRRYEVITYEDAARDIELICNFIAAEPSNQYSALLLKQRIYAKIFSLSFAPRRVLVKNNIYKVFVSHYRIIYKVVGNEVHVLRVIDMRTKNDFGL